MLKKQLDFIVKGSEVKRFHTVRTIQEETNGHHQFMVAMLYFLIAPSNSIWPMLACLTHDLSEHVVGDIPANTKRLFANSIEEEEENIRGEVALQFPVSESEKRLLKLADVLSGLLFCRRELALGNVGLKVIEGRYSSYLDKLAHFNPVEEELVRLIREY